MTSSLSLCDIEITSLDAEGHLIDLHETYSAVLRSPSVWEIHDGLKRQDAIKAVNDGIVSSTNYLYVSSKTDSNLVSTVFEYLQHRYTSPIGIMAFLTSGSMGAPKIVVHSVDSLIESASKMVHAYPELINKRFHHLFPTTYVAGILNCIILPLVAHGSIFLDKEFNFSSPFNLAKNIAIAKSEVAWLSPAMIASISAMPKRFKPDQDNLTLILSATGPLTTEVRQRAEEIFGCRVLNTYGTSELLFISGERFSDGDVTLGEPFRGIKVEYIQSSMHAIQEDPTVYELLVQTNTKALQVLNFNKETMVLSPDASFNGETIDTQDLVNLKNGFPMPAGRKDDVVVLGGINISLGLIENNANTYPGLLESCARADFGMTSTSIQLFYEIAPESDGFNEEDFRSYLKEILPPESLPRRLQEVIFVRSANGKIQKNKIRIEGEGYIPK